MSLRDRYCRSRLRRPTSSSSPRRLWWSCLCTLRCSVRSWIRRVSSATWTSGEPVSPSLVACPAIISFFTVVSSGTLIPLHVGTVIRTAPKDHVGPAGARRAPCGSLGLLLAGQPHEGAADRAEYSGRSEEYHARRPSALTLHVGAPAAGSPPLA